MAAAILFLSSVAQPARLLSRPHPFYAASKLCEQESRSLSQLRGAMSPRGDARGGGPRGRTQGQRPFERRPASFVEGLRGVHLPRSAKVEAGGGGIDPQSTSPPKWLK
ncbi:hypothetical protein T484DRAFT_1866111 [Baffinella frigidus]|nr:hypothetical protein T484DRAFT_1866111 [Cryptophyta sp. CCMP2293]